MKIISFLLAGALVSFGSAASAQAAGITIPNYDLQLNPSYGTIAVVDTTQESNVIQDFTETYTPGSAGHYGDAGVGAPDGTTSAFINTDNNGSITLTNDFTAGGTLTAPTFVTGLTYTLTLEIGINPTNQNTSYDRTGNITFGLLSGGNVAGIETAVPTGTIVPTLDADLNPQVTFETFTYTYTATAADNNKAIAIQINDAYPGGSQTEFSDLTLNAVPEPGTWAMVLGGFAILAFAIRFRTAARL